MTEEERQEFMLAIERLETFRNAEPSRRFLVAIDKVLLQLAMFRRRVCDAIAGGSTDPRLTHWDKESESLIEQLSDERLRISALLRQRGGMN